jgi:hypothetical protein
MFWSYRLLRFEDIESRTWPKDAPYEATYFMYQTLGSQMNICSHNVMLRVTNRRFLMG